MEIMETKHLPFRRLAICLLSFMAILAQNVRAQGFTPDMFPGQLPDRTQYEVSATVKVGEYAKSPNKNSYVTDLTSTDQSVVQTFTGSGVSVVLIVGTGTADVTYTEQMYTLGTEGMVIPVGDPTTHTIHYTVVKGQSEAKYVDRTGEVSKARLIWDGKDPNVFTFTPPALEVNIKDVYTIKGVPEMLNKYISASECVFESSNPAVATVTARSVTPVSYGKTIIRATWPGNVNWYGTIAEYELTVEEPKENVYINFYQPSITGFAGEYMTAPLNVQMLTIDRWSSENPKIASVDETTGKVQFLTPGTTRIFAYIDETDTHYAAQGYYSVTVKKRNAELSFSETEAFGELNVPFTPPTLINPHEVAIDKWYSSDTKVASVDEATGEVTINGLGDAYIVCEFTGNDYYEAATANYLLHVSTSGVRVMGITVTSLNADDVLGDGSKKVTYDTNTNTLNLNNWIVDASALDPAIKSGVIVNSSNKALTINPTGECAILNADLCILSMKSAVIFKSESKTGKLRLTTDEATQSIAIEAFSIKIHECDLKATGTVVAMKLGHELTISKSAHVYAESTGSSGFAIQCSNLLLADESAGILTPGVHYYEPYMAFFDDEENKVRSKIVEIGKVPVTAPDDEVTVIQFNVTDPEDNETVVFSASANDSFNEETGQLEISTSLTDQQVAEALESFIPGSSAWIDFLPGSLVFDIPAGKGEILVNCMTFPGFSLNVMIEGQGAVSITQAEPGWAKVSYDVAVPTHVVVYLHASSSSAPKAAPKKTQASPSAYIKAIKIVPESCLTAVEAIKADKPVSDGKYLKNGRLYIVRDGRIFDVTGIEVK